MTIFEETFTLSGGGKIPKMALGTWLIDNSGTKEAVKTAIELGYRHIDTAQAYGNENGVGAGVRASGIGRDKIFVTSKIAAEHKSYQTAKNSIEESLRAMEFEYIDLMLIHSPQPWAEVNQSDNRYREENKEVWRALEDALKEGKLRAIGISNFLQEDIENLMEDCTVKPMVNQVLAHITNTPFELIDYCQKQNIVVEAYSPVAHGEALKNPGIVGMAEKYGVSPAQLCIQYDLQLGLVVLPKTATPSHMEENARLDFVISQTDMDILKNLEHIKDYGESSFFPVYGGKM